MLKIHPGRHTLTIKLYTSKLTVTQQEQSIIIKPVEQIAPESNPPKVCIVTPSEGMQIVSRSTVKVEASAEAPLSWVEVFLNGKRIYQANEAPFQFALDPDRDHLKYGTYTLTAHATDIFGNEATSAPVKVTIGIPSEWTRPIPDNPQSPDSLIGELPTTFSLFPSGGASLERQPYSNLIAPPVTWSDGGSLLPALNASSVRVPALTDPGLAAFSLMPVKSMPGLDTSASLPQLVVQGVTQTPSLAAWPSQLAPVGVAGGLTPVYGVLCTPMTASSLATSNNVRAAVQPGAPLLAIPVAYTTPDEKATPQLGVLIVPATPAVTAAVSSLAPATSSVAPAKPGATPTTPGVRSSLPSVVPPVPAVTQSKPSVEPTASVAHIARTMPTIKPALHEHSYTASVSQPLGRSAAPVIGEGSAVPTSQAPPAMHVASKWPGQLTPETLPVSWPATAGVVPAPSLPESSTAPAQTPLLLAKAEPRGAHRGAGVQRRPAHAYTGYRIPRRCGQSNACALTAHPPGARSLSRQIRRHLDQELPALIRLPPMLWPNSIPG